ncbi:hypothetical protein BJ944DRAFT_51368 [Cunninghamella echinulata]|nr:hypothetical protein BJ944DRAFT_51368 [Cunninghamella echinulata]
MASKSITADISYYVTIDEEKIVKRQRLFQCNNNNNDHNLNVQQQITSKVLSRSSSLQILAKTWLSHYNNTNMRSSLLNDIIELKRKLLFSIDQFVQFLDLSTIPSKDILPLLIAYHTWSKLTYGTLMPLMALLFPLIQMDINNITINNNNNGNDSSTLIDCFHRVQDETVLQDYLEAIIHYLHFNILNSMIEKERLEKEKQKSNIILVQSWMDKLLEQDRKNIAFYSISGNNHSSCSSLYLTYYDVFLDKDRLKYLSWNDKKRWIMKEWDSWIQFLIGNNKNVDNDDNQMQLWMQEKINIIHYGDKLDKQYLMLIEKNMLWFNEFNSNISSSLISYTADLLLTEKV